MHDERSVYTTTYNDINKNKQLRNRFLQNRILSYNNNELVPTYKRKLFS